MKRWIAATMIFAMLLSLAACGEKEEINTTPSGTEGSTGITEGTEATQPTEIAPTEGTESTDDTEPSVTEPPTTVPPTTVPPTTVPPTTVPPTTVPPTTVPPTTVPPTTVPPTTVLPTTVPPTTVPPTTVPPTTVPPTTVPPTTVPPTTVPPTTVPPTTVPPTTVPPTTEPPVTESPKPTVSAKDALACIENSRSGMDNHRYDDEDGDDIWTVDVNISYSFGEVENAPYDVDRIEVAGFTINGTEYPIYYTRDKDQAKALHEEECAWMEISPTESLKNRGWNELLMIVLIKVDGIQGQRVPGELTVYMDIELLLDVYFVNGAVTRVNFTTDKMGTGFAGDPYLPSQFA